MKKPVKRRNNGSVAERRPAFYLRNYKAWKLEEGERYELIYGEAYAMSGPGTPRQIVSGELYDQFFTFLEGKPCRVFSAPFDVRLFYAEDESDDTVVQPDIMVVRDKTKLGPEGVRGAPDLVIEILSPSNTAIEMEKKLDLYREAGVREYRVVDPLNKKMKVYPFGENANFYRVYGGADAVPVTVLLGPGIALTEVFAETE